MPEGPLKRARVLRCRKLVRLTMVLPRGCASGTVEQHCLSVARQLITGTSEAELASWEATDAPPPWWLAAIGRLWDDPTAPLQEAVAAAVAAKAPVAEELVLRPRTRQKLAAAAADTFMTARGPALRAAALALKERSPLEHSHVPTWSLARRIGWQQWKTLPITEQEHWKKESLLRLPRARTSTSMTRNALKKELGDPTPRSLNLWTDFQELDNLTKGTKVKKHCFWCF